VEVGTAGTVSDRLKGRKGALAWPGNRRATMMHNPNQLPPTGSRVNEVVVEVLSTTVLVLAGIIAFAQFAYY
jgi:hypothetical protein